ncbi:MAG: hypothetical protein RR212_06645 [Bacteroidales bacterium]
MRKDNEQLTEVLQHEYNKKTGYFTHTEVPENATFEIDGYELKIKYSVELVDQPLNNYDSFEGWIMVCRRWGIFDKIIFDWREPTDVHGKDYQAFLYRIHQFSKVFTGWFEINKDAQKHLAQLQPNIYVCDKRILESIIDITWYFETGNKLKIDIPDQWQIHFEHGIVQIKAEIENYGIENALDEADNQVYTPWQLLINRWAYLPTSPKSTQQDLSIWSTMPTDIKDLIKVGFTERNFPFPADY